MQSIPMACRNDLTDDRRGFVCLNFGVEKIDFCWKVHKTGVKLGKNGRKRLKTSKKWENFIETRNNVCDTGSIKRHDKIRIGN